MISAYVKMWRKYAVFSGRAGADEYWWAQLTNLLIAIFLLWASGEFDRNAFKTEFAVERIPYLIYAFAAFIPTSALTFRRLHDTGKSGWWSLIYFVPFVGGIAMIFMCSMESQEGENKFGPNPRIVRENGAYALGNSRPRDQL